MELLAGEPDLEVTVMESDVELRFNYGQVYWNSRLQAEHARVLAQVQPGEVVVDMFAGAGPFAVPAARHRKAVVHANDLNPHAPIFLAANAARNKIDRGVFKVYNLDGRELVSGRPKTHPRFLLIVYGPPTQLRIGGSSVVPKLSVSGTTVHRSS